MDTETISKNSNSFRVVEPETISKNGASPKSLTSRGNIMQRILLFFVVFCVSMISTFAQDVITLKNGDDIHALVQEIGDVDIKYKKIDNLNGPNYTLKKSEVFMIRYANGSKDVFTDNLPTSPSVTETVSAPVPIHSGTFVCDIITLKNGMDIHVLVQKSGEDGVKFKMYDKPDGTIYTLKKPEIATVMYADGNKDDFSTVTPEPLPKLGNSNRAVTQYEAKVDEFFQDFANRMNICGFTKRILLQDFLNESWFKTTTGVDRYGGIWLNYQKRLIALRPERYSYNEIIVPIDNIQSVEIIEDGSTRATVGVLGYSATSQEFAQNIQIRIVIGDINTGTQSYFFKLWDSFRLNKSREPYRNIEEFTRSLFDEIEFMSRNSR